MTKLLGAKPDLGLSVLGAGAHHRSAQQAPCISALGQEGPHPLPGHSHSPQPGWCSSKANREPAKQTHSCIIIITKAINTEHGVCVGGWRPSPTTSWWCQTPAIPCPTAKGPEAPSWISSVDQRRWQPVSCPDSVVDRLSSPSGSVVWETPSWLEVCSEHRPGRHVGSGHDGWGCGSQEPPSMALHMWDSQERPGDFGYTL